MIVDPSGKPIPPQAPSLTRRTPGLAICALIAVAIMAWLIVGQYGVIELVLILALLAVQGGA